MRGDYLDWRILACIVLAGLGLASGVDWLHVAEGVVQQYGDACRLISSGLSHFEAFDYVMAPNLEKHLTNYVSCSQIRFTGLLWLAVDFDLVLKIIDGLPMGRYCIDDGWPQSIVNALAHRALRLHKKLTGRLLV